MVETLSLRECAERLGVHYMTAYRYVRLGRLRATKVGVEWRVSTADLNALLVAAAAPHEVGGADWSPRLEDRLLAGDGVGAWALVEAALAAGLTPTGIHVDLLAPALQRIGDGWCTGAVSVAEEHRATAAAARIIGRLGPRFARRGRHRGRIVIGTPPGERHALGVATVSDLLRGAGWDVSEIGVDLPVDGFISAVEKAAPVAAIAVSVSCDNHLDAARVLIDAIKHVAVAPVVVGGGAVDSTISGELRADGWGSDARSAVEVVAALVG